MRIAVLLLTLVVPALVPWRASAEEASPKDGAPTNDFRLTGLEHFVLGSMGATARAGRTNTASSADPASASNLPVEIDETDVKEVKVGYDDKPILRDLYGLVTSTFGPYKPPTRQGALDDLFIDAFKLQSTVAFGDVLKLHNGMVDESKLTTTDANQTTYSVFLSYKLPLEVLWGHVRYRAATGSWGYRDKESWGTPKDK